MCNAPSILFSIPHCVIVSSSRSKLHKYIMRGKSNEKILREIESGRSCIYEKASNDISPLFNAIYQKNEEIVRKLMEIHEKDLQLLKENGYSKDSDRHVIAFGPEEISFVEEKLSSKPQDANDGQKLFILLKETNSTLPKVKVFDSKSDEDQKLMLEIIGKMFKNGTTDINQTAYFGTTFFHLGAHQGMIWLLEKLLELGAKHDSKSDDQITPFDYARIGHQLETVKWFHKKFNIDLTKYLLEGVSLFAIASSGDFEIFDYMITEVKKHEDDHVLAEIFNRKTEFHSQNFLAIAITSLQPEFVIKCINKYDLDLSVKDALGNNLLYSALTANPHSIELIKLLIKKKPELLLDEHSNSLHCVAVAGLLDELKNIYEQFPDHKSLFFKGVEPSNGDLCSTSGHASFKDVIVNHHLKVAEFLVDNHPDEFESSVYISEILIVAGQQNNSLELIKKLQTMKHFDINVPDAAGNYPLLDIFKVKQFDNFVHLLSTCEIDDLNKFTEPWTNNNLLFYAIWMKPTPCAPDCNNYPSKSVEVDSSGDEIEEETFLKGIPSYDEDPNEEFIMFDFFKDLVKRGMNISLKDSNESTLLHSAVKKDNLRVAKELLKLGLNVDSINSSGNLPLHHVRSLEMFKLLMECGTKEMINQKNNIGQTPFTEFISSHGHLASPPMDFMIEFFKYDPDVNSRDIHGHHPLHRVNIEWMKFLIEKGADVNAVNEQGENAIHCALRIQRADIAKYLLKHTDIDRFAVSKNDVSYLGYFSHTNLNYKDIFDSELEEIFVMLVDKFKNGKTYDGRRLPVSLFQDNSEFALRLILHPESDVHQKESDGNTCLHHIIDNVSDNSLEIIKILLDKGLDINCVNDARETPLMCSIDRRQEIIASFLIDHEKINLNLRNRLGETAAHYAAKTGQIDILCKLLAAGADYKIVSNDNRAFIDFLKNSEQKLFKFYK